MAFIGGLSFNLEDVIIPPEKDALVQSGYDEVEEVLNNYNMGFITNNERYNAIIDILDTHQCQTDASLMEQTQYGSARFQLRLYDA
jgi:DNA-directed RNA polymerase subunit beta'